jgi:hypothetical protein
MHTRHDYQFIAEPIIKRVLAVGTGTNVRSIYVNRTDRRVSLFHEECLNNDRVFDKNLAANCGSRVAKKNNVDRRFREFFKSYGKIESRAFSGSSCKHTSGKKSRSLKDISDEEGDETNVTY